MARITKEFLRKIKFNSSPDRSDKWVSLDLGELGNPQNWSRFYKARLAKEAICRLPIANDLLPIFLIFLIAIY